MLWLDQVADLTRFLQKHSNAELVVMDTEFIRERTYFPELALVQVCMDDEIALIDPTQPGIAEQLVPFLSNPQLLKIMHSSSEDLQAFKAGCGVVPSPIFDTQVAAALCGLGSGLSYLKLVEQVCGLTLTKGETRSDWLQRPLSDAQKQYAADDVRYLFPIYQFLNDKLAELNRRHWLDDDCQRAVNAAKDDLPDANPHLSIRTNHSMDQSAQLRLRRILRWRDQRAIEKNKPKRWIIDHDVAFALSRNPLSDIHELDQIMSRYPKSPKGARANLFALLQKPFDEEERQAPTIAEPAQQQKSQLKALQQVVVNVAAELNVPESLLCSRKHLEYLLETGLWPPSLNGWRKPFLSEKFDKIINHSSHT